MGLGGVVFGVIVVGWLAYLVPSLLRRHEAHPEQAADPFGGRVTQVHRASRDDDAGDPADWQLVSTPVTRRAELADLRRRERRAVKMRRGMLVLSVAGVLVAAVLTIAGWTPWWVIAAAALSLIAFLLVARVSTAISRRAWTRRYQDIAFGDEEPTVSLRLPGTGRAVDLSPPTYTGSLWEPVPVTSPTYVQKPLAARTVRTIDLTAPVPMGHPPTADRPRGASPAVAHDDETASALGPEWPRAVGE